MIVPDKLFKLVPFLNIIQDPSEPELHRVTAPVPQH
jgi:hypothetical protein